MTIDRPSRLKRVYDDYRTVQMSRQYYACLLDRYKKWNFVFDVVLAVGASGGAVAGWYFWQTQSGKPIWTAFAGMVAIFSILKPIVQLPKEVDRYSRLHSGYTSLFYDLRALVDDIGDSGGITETMRGRLSRVQKRYQDLALLDDPSASSKLLRKCQQEVNRRFPSFTEWSSKLQPKRSNTHAESKEKECEER